MLEELWAVHCARVFGDRLLRMVCVSFPPSTPFKEHGSLRSDTPLRGDEPAVSAYESHRKADCRTIPGSHRGLRVHKGFKEISGLGFKIEGLEIHLNYGMYLKVSEGGGWLPGQCFTEVAGR